MWLNFEISQTSIDCQNLLEKEKINFLTQVLLLKSSDPFVDQ